MIVATVRVRNPPNHSIDIKMMPIVIMVPRSRWSTTSAMTVTLTTASGLSAVFTSAPADW